MNHHLKLIVQFIGFVALLGLNLNDAWSYNDTSSYQRSSYGEFKSFSLEAVYSAEQTRDYSTGKHDGLYNRFDVAGTYSLDQKNDLRLYGSAIYHIFDGSTKEYYGKSAEFSWDLVEFMYRRNSILNHKQHGVSLDLELKNYYLLDATRREQYGFDGAFIPQVIMKKRFSRRFITELRLRRHFYFTNNDKDSTLQYENRAYFIPTYVVTRHFFISSMFKYKNKLRKKDYFSFRTFSQQPKSTEELYFRPSLMYLLTNKILVEGYWESKVAQSGDQKALVENWVDKGVFGISAFYEAF